MNQYNLLAHQERAMLRGLPESPMIINDSNRLVFIHIPKCAGTTVRNAVQIHDEMSGRFTFGGNDEHEALGRIDYAHIPLFILRRYFAEEYRKVVDYESYAIVRDPYSRFASSFSQYLRRSGAGQIQDQTFTDLKKGMDRAICTLQQFVGPQTYLPYNYIHFQRQVDFIYDQNVCIIKNLYDTSEVLAILTDMNARLGIGFDMSRLGSLSSVPRANEGLVYRSAWIGMFMEFSLPLVRIIKRSRFKKFVKEGTHRLFYVPRSEKLKGVFESQYVREFVSAYYAADLAFYKEFFSRKPEANK